VTAADDPRRDGDAEHPDDAPDVVALSASLRAEWQAEQAALTHEAAEEWLHGRTLVEIARECLHRGDRMRATVWSQQFSGEVLEVGTDLLALRTTSGRVDVHLHPAVPVVLQPERARRGGSRGVAATGSFRGALLAREASGAVVIGTTIAEHPFEGRLIVGRDHVCVVDGDRNESYVPIGSITFVAPRASER